MFLSQRTANAFGYIALVILLSLFILDWFGFMPAHLRLPLFFLALALFMTRVTLRLILERRRRLAQKKAREPGHGQDAAGEKKQESGHTT